MAEYEVTGVRYQMGDGLTMEERTRMVNMAVKTDTTGSLLDMAELHSGTDPIV